MKNQYYLKDKKATIYKRLPSTQNSNGVWIKGKVMPITAAPVWCFARQEGQSISFSSSTKIYFNDESRLFIFCNNPHIKQGDYVLYRGLWYTIQRVYTRDDYAGDMFVYVDETAQGDWPRDNELIPYDPTKL